jgi:predicted transposase YbfD/YdcC
LLGQVAVGGAGDEVPAALELLRSLDIKGTTVTADANSCASEVTQAIRDGGGHYILALKGNRGALHDHVEHCFAVARGDGYPEAPPHVTGDQAHGRTERRFVRAMPMGQLPPNIRAPWAALKTIVQVERVRLTDHLSVHRSYYITSHPPHAAKLAVRIRDHWKIENELHYCLDVTFGEERRAIRSEYGAQNFALVCRYALSLLKRDPTKLSVAAKKKPAGARPTFLKCSPQDSPRFKMRSPWGYGTGAKLMSGYRVRSWQEQQRHVGAVATDLGGSGFELQNLWDSSLGQTGTTGILTNFVGGRSGITIGKGSAGEQWQRRLADAEILFPGLSEAHLPGKVVRELWSTRRWSLGSYACYKPGQAVNAAVPMGVEAGVHFCGEHTSVGVQGYMEGAAESGARAAAEVLKLASIGFPVGLQRVMAARHRAGSDASDPDWLRW